MTAVAAGLRLLVVDDDVLFRTSLARQLRTRGHHVEVADSVALAKHLATSSAPDALLLDLHLSDGDGLELLVSLRDLGKVPRTIIMTGDAAQTTAVASFRAGARDFLVKPFTSDSLEAALDRVVADLPPSGSVPTATPPAGMALERRPSRSFAPEMVGEHGELLAALAVAERVARTDSTVLIRGETGTGKELVARAIHQASKRASGPFVALNSATIPEALSEAELFGAARGAYTGSVAVRVGKFLAATGGTLFLDEIGEMPLGVQAKLLRALQEREVTPVGDNRAIRVDVRVIAATHADLDGMVEAKRFRADLLYRLDVVRVELPPLRRRRGDLRLLCQHFLERLAKKHERAPLTVSPETLALFDAHPWPGNVRQLENVLESALLLRDVGAILNEDLPARFREQNAVAAAGPMLPATGVDLKELIERFEGELVRQALDRTGGNRTKAAALLGLNRTTLVEKLKKLGLDAREAS